MAIPRQNLDDRTYDQLSAEARSLIQRYCPAWTDYNPSDAGIMLLELFAFLFEAAIYQINRVPERSFERFAGLVGVPRDGDPIPALLQRTLTALRATDRAITENDFEALAINAAPDEVARCRARVVPLPASDPNAPPDSIVNIIIVPAHDLTAADLATLCGKVFDHLSPLRLITTRVSVVPADRTDVKISMTIARAVAGGIDAGALAAAVQARVQQFLDDRGGGRDGKGWPFGRPLYRSDLYHLVEGIPGVDHVDQLLLHLDASPEDDASREAIPLASSLSLIGAADVAVSVV